MKTRIGVLLLCVLTSQCHSRPQASHQPLCTAPDSAQKIPVSPNREAKPETFADLFLQVESSCGSCHTGQNALGAVALTKDNFPDLSERMLKALTEGRMPPVRSGHEEALERIKISWQAWDKAGRPTETAFLSNAALEPGPFPTLSASTTDLGNCDLGLMDNTKPTDSGLRDAAFASMKTLPLLLSATDVQSFESRDLASAGVYSYNVEYPLWSDGSLKMRFIKVPSDQAISLDAANQTFRIPENTRFYKTFLKPYTDSSGFTGYRRVETRLIVVRYPSQKALFGVYRWNASETEARLVTESYRDGTPWKDQIVEWTLDAKGNSHEPYLIPGRQRCVECHSGSSSESFVLGFDPLQIRRESQIERLTRYGILKDVREQDIVPLESRGQLAPVNDFALKAQGYMIGNCAHCHNPKGYALQDENVRYDFSPGKLFPFEDPTTSTGVRTTIPKTMVREELEKMPIFNRMIQNESRLSTGVYRRVFLPMPAHGVGKPDCKGLTDIGRWLLAYNNPEAAGSWSPACDSYPARQPQSYDITLPETSPYKPRRPDWQNPESGLQKYIQPAAEVQAGSDWEGLLSANYPVQFWKPSPECSFPKAQNPQQKPVWFAKENARDPNYFSWDHVYWERPGHFFFRKVCSSCHGRRGESDTGMALYLFNLSQGSIIPANFKKGLFDPEAKNIALFGDEAFAYVIWMASEGTRFDFKNATDLSDFLGSNYKNMLYKVQNDFCATLVQPKWNLDSNPAREIYGYEIFSRICTHNNPLTEPIVASKTAADRTLYQQWLTRAGFNAGYAIFRFLRDDAFGKDASKGFQPFPNYCSEAFTH